jgi:DNA repair exonuclease SbcCD ATPase subunit
MNKLEVHKNDKKNEIEIMELIHKKKIENLEKNILYLSNTINELTNENKRQPKEVDYYEIQSEIYQNFSELDQKIKKYDNENFLLKKENQKLKNENEELKIIINGKENIINKLQSDISKIENDFKIKISELNSVNNKDNIINENIKSDINNNENLDNLLKEKKMLIEENEILKENYEQMTRGINEANELFINKQNEYENMINLLNEKLKEYKFKISLLKIKINELYSEIQTLKGSQIRSSTSYFQPLNDNYLSSIEKERQTVDLNFTPEQIKLINFNTPVMNQMMNPNYGMNNLQSTDKNIK